MGRNASRERRITRTEPPEPMTCDAQVVVILEHALAMAKQGRHDGVVLMLEAPDGGYHVLMTATDDADKRLGKLLRAVYDAMEDA